MVGILRFMFHGDAVVATFDVAIGWDCSVPEMTDFLQENVLDVSPSQGHPVVVNVYHAKNLLDRMGVFAEVELPSVSEETPEGIEY